MNYLIRLSYDGSHYFGFGKQNNVCTIQQELESCLSKLLNEKVKVIGSGRTDRGVHALNQYVSFKTNAKFVDTNKIKTFLDKHLSNGIKIISVKKVNDNFHAQHDVKVKTYQYIINNQTDNLFERNYVWFIKDKLDLTKLKQGAKVFIGTHDFSSFASSDLDNKIRTIYDIKITKQKELIKITISGNGFLRNMVRFIVGSLVAYSLNQIDFKQLSFWLNHPKKGSSLFKAIPNGLYLFDVKY